MIAQNSKNITIGCRKRKLTNKLLDKFTIEFISKKFSFKKERGDEFSWEMKENGIFFLYAL